MHTGEAADLASERRLNATLSFSAHCADVLVQNGGSRAEEVSVETIVDLPRRRIRRASYCIDGGTSLPLLFPLLEDEAPEHFHVRITGGYQDIELFGPRPRRLVPVGTKRAGLSVIAAAGLIVAFGGRLAPSLMPPPTIQAGLGPADSVLVAQPAPQKIVAVSLPKLNPPIDEHVETRLVRHRGSMLRRGHHAVVVAAALPAAPPPAAAVAAKPVPKPVINALKVPFTARNGDPVSIAVAAHATKTRIVASIGPTIISKQMLGGRGGTVTFTPPSSSRQSRIMTVRAYAQNGSRTSVSQALIVLVGPQ